MYHTKWKGAQVYVSIYILYIDRHETDRYKLHDSASTVKKEASENDPISYLKAPKKKGVMAKAVRKKIERESLLDQSMPDSYHKE